jgi:hypothetical protein
MLWWLDDTIISLHLYYIHATSSVYCICRCWEIDNCLYYDFRPFFIISNFILTQTICIWFLILSEYTWTYLLLIPCIHQHWFIVVIITVIHRVRAMHVQTGLVVFVLPLWLSKFLFSVCYIAYLCFTTHLIRFSIL